MGSSPYSGLQSPWRRYGAFARKRFNFLISIIINKFSSGANLGNFAGRYGDGCVRGASPRGYGSRIGRDYGFRRRPSGYRTDRKLATAAASHGA